MMETSDERTRKLVEEQTKKDIANFDPEKDVEHLPYEEENLIFEQIGNRIRWKSRGERYYARRFFPSAECAEKTMEILKELRK